MNTGGGACASAPENVFGQRGASPLQADAIRPADEHFRPFSRADGAQQGRQRFGSEANTIEDVNRCGAWTGCTEAFGNISVDPLFVDSAGGNYHLQDTSQCIDTGIDPTYYITPALVDFDFEGDARPHGAG